MPRIEDLYEAAPLEIELTGGYFDGRRMRVPDHRDRWLFPVPPAVSLTAELATGPSLEIEEYRWTGSIRDDGTRVFQVVA